MSFTWMLCSCCEYSCCRKPLYVYKTGVAAVTILTFAAVGSVSSYPDQTATPQLKVCSKPLWTWYTLPKSTHQWPVMLRPESICIVYQKVTRFKTDIFQMTRLESSHHNRSLISDSPTSEYNVDGEWLWLKRSWTKNINDLLPWLVEN